MDFKEQVIKFYTERNWDHKISNKSLVTTIAATAQDLCLRFDYRRYLGVEGAKERTHDQLTTIAMHCILLAKKLDINLDDIVMEKFGTQQNKLTKLIKFFKKERRHDPKRLLLPLYNAASDLLYFSSLDDNELSKKGICNRLAGVYYYTVLFSYGLPINLEGLVLKRMEKERKVLPYAISNDKGINNYLINNIK